MGFAGSFTQSVTELAIRRPKTALALATIWFVLTVTCGLRFFRCYRTESEWQYQCDAHIEKNNCVNNPLYLVNHCAECREILNHYTPAVQCVLNAMELFELCRGSSCYDAGAYLAGWIGVGLAVGAAITVVGGGWLSCSWIFQYATNKALDSTRLAQNTGDYKRLAPAPEPELTVHTAPTAFGGSFKPPPQLNFRGRFPNNLQSEVD